MFIYINDCFFVSFLDRPKEISTEEFGKLWPEYSLDQRLILDVKGHSVPSIMSALRSIHMFPVEIIGEWEWYCPVISNIHMVLYKLWV